MLLVGLVLAVPAHAAGTADSFQTTRWSATVDVSEDGSVRVQHVIEVRFSEPRRGIYLDVPARVSFRDDGGTPTRTLAYDDITAPGVVAVAHGSSVTRIRLGDPDEQVSGPQTYTVGYTVRGAVETSSTDGRPIAFIPVVEPSWDGAIPSFELLVTSAFEGTRTCVVGSSSVAAPEPCSSGILAGRRLLDDQGVWASIDFATATVPLSAGMRPPVEDVDALLRSPGPDRVGGILRTVGVIVASIVGFGFLISRLPTDEPGSGGGSSSSTDTSSSSDSWSSSDSGSSDSGSSDSGSSDSGGGGDW